MDQSAGMYLNRKLEDVVDKGDILCTLYSGDKWRLKEAAETVKNMAVYIVK
jgi:thymidine phosphorylase